MARYSVTGNDWMRSSCCAICDSDPRWPVTWPWIELDELRLLHDMGRAACACRNCFEANVDRIPDAVVDCIDCVGGKKSCDIAIYMVLRQVKVTG
jgi:hypothetical protein